jgi:hypothetical protein
VPPHDRNPDRYRGRMDTVTVIRATATGPDTVEVAGLGVTVWAPVPLTAGTLVTVIVGGFDGPYAVVA